MAVTGRVDGQYGTYYYIDSSSSRDVLTLSQMQTNVQYLLNVKSALFPSWTLEALAALCGNGQSEGALNPSQWQYGMNKSLNGGYGLWQWTPATKFLDWASAGGLSQKDPRVQMQRLDYEKTEGIQYYPTANYNFSFESFLTGSHTVQELALAWLYNYERPADPASTESIRVSRSLYWYGILQGETPQPPGPTPDPPEPPVIKTKTRGMPFYMYPGWRSI